jgi:SPP1 family predicted phage head-tail adaptor
MGRELLMATIQTQAAGERNKRVIVEWNDPVTNADGQQTENWVRKFPHWAEIVPRAGREARRFDQVRAEVDHIIRMLHTSLSSQIKPADWRVKFGTRVFNIGAAFTVKEQQAIVELQCTEIVI